MGSIGYLLKRHGNDLAIGRIEGGEIVKVVEQIGVKGVVEFEVRRADGTVERDVVKNTWTQVGIQQVIAWMNDEGPNTPAYIGFGSDDGTALPLASTNTALGAESTYANTAEGSRVAATKSKVATNFNNDTLQMQSTWNFTESETVRETGVFDAATGGNMFARTIRSGDLVMESGDTLTITWKLYFEIP